MLTGMSTPTGLSGLRRTKGVVLHALLRLCVLSSQQDRLFRTASSACVLTSSTSLRLDSSAGICMAFCAFSIPFSWFVVRDVGFAEDGTALYMMPVYAENDEQREEIAKSDTADTAAALGDADK